MCVVSNLGDQWGRDFPGRYPNVPVQPYIYPQTGTSPSQVPHPFQPTQDALKECVVCGNSRSHIIHSLFEPTADAEPEISKEEFDALRKEVEELKILLLAAKRFDEATGQADCEMDEKIELIRRVADFVGVDVDEVFGARDST